MQLMTENDPHYRELIKVDLQVLLHSPFLEANFYNFPKFADALKSLGFEVTMLNTREISVATAHLPVDPNFGALIASRPDEPISIRIQQDFIKLSWDLSIGHKYLGFNALVEHFASMLDAVNKDLGFSIPCRGVNIAYKSFLPKRGADWIHAVIKPEWFPGIVDQASDIHQMLFRWRGKTSLDRSLGIDNVEVSRFDDEGNVVPHQGVLLTMVSGEVVKSTTDINWRDAFSRVHDDATKFLEEAIVPDVVKAWTS